LSDAIEAIPEIEPADWANRSRVEFRAAGSRGAWFCHARTGGRRLLDVELRVSPGAFDQPRLRADLGIKTLDERTDLPVYGQWSRVEITSPTPEHDAVRIQLRDMQDIRKGPFRSFLRRAAQSYLTMVKQRAADPKKAEPWREDGRTWHLSQRSVRGSDKARWRPTVLVELAGRLKKLDRRIELDWSTKTAVMLRRQGAPCRVGRIVTNQARGLKVEFQTAPGAITPTQVERLGREPSIKHHRGLDWVSFWLTRLSELDAGQLTAVLRAAVATARPAEAEAP
jgi:hypothetical protein